MSDYITLKIKIEPYSSDAADLIAAFLADIGFESFEEKEDGLNAHITEDTFSESMLASTLEDFPMDVRISWDTEKVKQVDWNAEWEKNYFQPIVLGGGRCVVHATFHQDFPQAEYEIVIDPKMAFGTGHHATTSMMTDHLLGMDLKGKSVIDMGTGTGILAILASKLGAKEVTGIEIDNFAFLNALDNAALNNADITLIEGDASKLEFLNSADVFLANINRNIILADLDRYVARIAPGGILVLSGFYNKDVPLLERALLANGMQPIETVTVEGGWSSLKAVKNA